MFLLFPCMLAVINFLMFPQQMPAQSFDSPVILGQNHAKAFTFTPKSTVHAPAISPLPSTVTFIACPFLKGITVSAPPALYPQLPSASCAKTRPPKSLFSSLRQRVYPSLLAHKAHAYKAAVSADHPKQRIPSNLCGHITTVRCTHLFFRDRTI